MSDQASGSVLVQDRAFQDQLAKMDEDADGAEQQWKAQLGDSGIAKFPPDLLAEYKKDGAQLVKARGDFNLEWNRVVVGKGDPKKLLATYDAYSTSLGALIENNARYKALIDMNLAGKVAAWLTLLLAFGKLVQATELMRAMRELKAELEKAEREVFDAKLKRLLNGAASVVTLILVPESALARVAVAAGGITVHIIIDNALGHGTAKGTVVFIAGDGPVLIEKLSEGGKKFAGAAAAVITFKFDSDEVAEGEKVLKRLRPKFERAQKEYQDFMAGVLPLVPKLQQLEAGIKALNAAAKNALTRSNDAAKNYKAIRDSIKKAM